MRLLITRPREDAEPLAEILRRRGIEVILEPLLEVTYDDGPGVDLDGVQALLVTSAAGAANATRYTGSLTTETTVSRSTSECDMLVSEQMPFGVVSWTATTVNEQKNPTEPRSTFEEVVVLTEELTAVEIRDDGETELVTE